MRIFLTIFVVVLILNSNSITFADHANEPYCFDCMHKYKIGDKKNVNFHKFRSNLQDNDLSKTVDEMISDKKTGLVSYLLWENNKILVDQNRKSKYRGGYYPSHSVGKSLVSLVTGYAICDGYINSVFDNIDYPTVANTLYKDQKLLNLLNMQAGDEPIVGQRFYRKDNRVNGKGTNVNSTPIKTVLKRHFEGKTGYDPGNHYNYSAMTTNVIMNYVIYKTGDDWEKLLNKIFVEDAKVEKSVYFGKSLEKHKFSNRKKGEYGRYSFYAQRYDYLRIAKLIMDHWKSDTCVGKYLKTIYERRISKSNRDKNEPLFGRTKTYGGQFHMDYPGLKDRVVFGFSGYGGNVILIDVEKSRIVVLNSVHYNNEKFKYSMKKLLIDPIKKGK